MIKTIEELASITQAEIIGDPSKSIRGINTLESANENEISFLSNNKYSKYLNSTNAGALLLARSGKINRTDIPLLIVDDVYVALARLLECYDNTLDFENTHQPDRSIIAPNSQYENVNIGPYCQIEAHVKIGEGSTLMGNNYIGKNVVIGQNCLLYPGVVIMHNSIIGDNCIMHPNSVIGSDGFGFAPAENGYCKVPQIGNVIIENNVEIGANTTIDRATMGSTVIGEGSKLDNLIQVAHNVKIGKHTVVAAQTGISGSSKVGDRCMLGGQVGLVGHITLANGTQVQAQSGITKSVTEENTKIYGSPAMPFNKYLRNYAVFKNLEELSKKVVALEKQLSKKEK